MTSIGDYLAFNTPRPVPAADRRTCDALLLAVTLGWCGGHHLYLRRPLWALLYVLTFGLFGIGWVIDILRVSRLTWLCNKRLRWMGERRERNPDMPPSERLSDSGFERDWSDTLVLLLGGGFLGLHYLYLRKRTMALTSVFTFGFCGFYLLDVFRFVAMTNSANRVYGAPCPRPNSRLQEFVGTHERSFGDAMVLHLSPLGMFGGSSAYLGKGDMALYGLCFPMLFGGWIVQLFTMGSAVTHANQRLQYQLALEREQDRSVDEEEGPTPVPLPKRPELKLKSDAYAMHLVLGLFGGHRFYLGQHGWGVVYLCTCGLLGLGWLADFFRLPFIVDEANAGTPKDPRLLPAPPGRVTVSEAARSAATQAFNAFDAALDGARPAEAVPVASAVVVVSPPRAAGAAITPTRAPKEV